VLRLRSNQIASISESIATTAITAQPPGGVQCTAMPHGRSGQLDLRARMQRYAVRDGSHLHAQVTCGSALPMGNDGPCGDRFRAWASS